MDIVRAFRPQATVGWACLLAILSLLWACQDEAGQASTPHPATPTPSATDAAPMAAAPTPTATGATVSTPSPAAAQVSAPTPTPTAREAAGAAIADLIPWFRETPSSYGEEAARLLVDLWLLDDGLGKAVTALPWMVRAPVSEAMPTALGALRDIASTEPDLARLVVGLPWFIDGLSVYERDALGALWELLLVDLDFGKSVASFPWFADGVTAGDYSTLYSLHGIALSDLELARGVIALPWVVDGLTDHEHDTLGALRDVLSVDLGLGKSVASLSWFTDGATVGDYTTLYSVYDIALADLELARGVIALPWFMDSVTVNERGALSTLREVLLVDLDLGKSVASLPWFTDGVTVNELTALYELARLASTDVPLAIRVAGFPWFTDDLTANESDALSTLRELASADLETAGWVVGFPWLADGVTDHDLQSLTAARRLVFLTGDFTDSDGDGMTDAAETRYGFDPNDASSFPNEPEVSYPERHPIRGAGMDAYYEVSLDRIDLRWADPNDGTFSLTLSTADSTERNIYYGGHPAEWAPVDLRRFKLSGTETLVGSFSKYGLDLNSVEEYSEFTIDLAAIQFPERSAIGSPSNRLSYTFSSNFPAEAENQYREFLRRVFPIMHGLLGPPAETLNVSIEDAGSIDVFAVFDGGRTLLTNAEFVPRLIVHEMVHAWKGRYSITSDENWEYEDSLTGFEEGIAEGMAFEIIHEYVRSYPSHLASLQLLYDRPFQYWSSMATSYDAMKNVRWTGAGDFWTPPEGVVNRYSIAATTVQMMIRENPDFARAFTALYYETIREDPDWRPNRDDLVAMWEVLVPELNGYPLSEYLDTLPVFNGRKLDEGIYILEHRRAYGDGGDQQFAVAYALPDGRLWWGVHEEDLQYIPEWVRTSSADDGRRYIDTQNSSFTVEVFDAYGEGYAVYNFETVWDRHPDGAPAGLGWYSADDLHMETFPVGLYKETVTFGDYINHDEGARETFYFFGLKGFSQDKEREYVIMIGVDGVPEGSAEIEVLGKAHTATISNGVAIFRSAEWPFDMQGRFTITITNAGGEARTYYRTLIEAGTLHDYFQHQFIIVDTDFNGTEDQFESPGADR